MEASNINTAPIRESCLLFTDRGTTYKFLSNEFERKIMIDGKIYHHLIAYIYSKQYELDNNIKAAQHMENQESVVYCKIYRRRNPIGNTSILTVGSTDIVYRALMIKFIADKDLAERLLRITSSKFKYGNNEDEYWGIGRSSKGKNVLGEIIYQIRDVLTAARGLGEFKGDVNRNDNNDT